MPLKSDIQSKQSKDEISDISNNDESNVLENSDTYQLGFQFHHEEYQDTNRDYIFFRSYRKKKKIQLPTCGYKHTNIYAVKLN